MPISTMGIITVSARTAEMLMAGSYIEKEPKLKKNQCGIRPLAFTSSSPKLLIHVTMVKVRGLYYEKNIERFISYLKRKS